MNGLHVFYFAVVGLVLLPCGAVALGIWLPLGKWRNWFESRLGLLAVYSAVMAVAALLISRYLSWHWLYANAMDIEEAARPVSTEAGRTFDAMNALWLRTRDAALDMMPSYLVDTGGSVLSLVFGLNAVVAAWRRKKPNLPAETTSPKRESSS